MFIEELDLYAYSFWKICHPVRLLQTVRLLEALEYGFINVN